MGPLFAGGGAGDRDYKQVVKDAFDSIDDVVSLKIDTKDINTIYLHEATKCLRRSSMIEWIHSRLNRHNSTKSWEDCSEK